MKFAVLSLVVCFLTLSPAAQASDVREELRRADAKLHLYVYADGFVRGYLSTNLGPELLMDKLDSGRADLADVLQEQATAQARFEFDEGFLKGAQDAHVEANLGRRLRSPWECELKDRDAQVPTITGGFDSFTRGRYGHPKANRAITPREAARLQGFPDWFRFHGNKSEVRAQLGNAVPVPLGEAIGNSIFHLLQVHDGLAKATSKDLKREEL